MLLYDYFESYSVQLSTEQDYFPILNSVVKFFSFIQYISVHIFSEICSYISFKITRNNLSDLLI